MQDVPKGDAAALTSAVHEASDSGSSAAPYEATEDYAVEVAEWLRTEGLLRHDGASSWRIHLLSNKGEVDVQAIVILAEVCQWYSPSRYDRSRTRFNGDAPDLSNQELQKVLAAHGAFVSPKTVQRAVTRLVDFGIIKRSHKTHGPPTEKKSGGATRWLKLQGDRLVEITHPVRVDPMSGDVARDTERVHDVHTTIPNTGRRAAAGSIISVINDDDLGLGGTKSLHSLGSSGMGIVEHDLDGDLLHDRLFDVDGGRTSDADEESGRHASLASEEGSRSDLEGEGAWSRLATRRTSILGDESSWPRATRQRRMLKNIFEYDLKWVRKDYERRWLRPSTPEFKLLATMPEDAREKLRGIESARTLGVERDVVRQAWSVAHHLPEKSLTDAVYKALNLVGARQADDASARLVAAAAFTCGLTSAMDEAEQVLWAYSSMKSAVGREGVRYPEPEGASLDASAVCSALAEAVAQHLDAKRLGRLLKLMLGWDAFVRRERRREHPGHKRAERALQKYVSALWSSSYRFLGDEIAWQTERAIHIALGIAEESGQATPTMEGFHFNIALRNPAGAGLDDDVFKQPPYDSKLSFMAKRIDGLLDISPEGTGW